MPPHFLRIPGTNDRCFALQHQLSQDGRENETPDLEMSVLGCSNKENCKEIVRSLSIPCLLPPLISDIFAFYSIHHETSRSNLVCHCPIQSLLPTIWVVVSSHRKLALCEFQTSRPVLAHVQHGEDKPWPDQHHAMQCPHDSWTNMQIFSK